MRELDRELREQGSEIRRELERELHSLSEI
jgi:hypothetical protein